MQTWFQDFLHTMEGVLRRMARAFVIWGAAITVVATAWFSLAAHRLPRGGEWGLVLGLFIAAGLLGTLVVLVWELSHIGPIMRAVQRQDEPHIIYHRH